MGLDNRLIAQPSPKPLMSERPSPSTIAQHWLKTLAGCECAPYPTLPAFVEQPVADRQTEYAFPPPRTLSRPITISTLVHAAWAIISGQMTGSGDVVFGATVSGGNIIPVRLQLDANQKVSQYLEEAQRQATDAARFDHMELREIAQISPDCQKACAFQTVLAAEPQNGRTWETEDGNSLKSLSTYGLTIHIQPTAAQIFARASFDSRAIEPSVAFKLLRRLEFVMQQLNNAGPAVALADLAMVSPLDLDQIREWNSGVPPVVERCIHDIVRERILAEPDAPAVCAWDGGLTYRELDNLSAKLASHLVDLGVGPERVVPLCFAKSMWTVVAMLSVLKAGGAFVLLDPGLPGDRVRGICQKVNAATGITSPSCESRLSPFTRKTVVLCKQTMDHLKLQDMERRVEMPKTNPQNAAYIIFTSGSTGEPKGCVIEHRSYCSAAFGHGKILGMSNSTRALQFGSYNFAGAIMEMVMTLIHGGCICIPSEEERASNLALVIGKLNANWAFLTSTVLALISPATAPSLRTVCVGGEPIRSSQIREWAPRVTLRQTFGSAETAAVVSSAGLDASSAVTSVGKATTARCWLVHPGDVNQLVPIGAPGEVIFEGPVIGRHYIGDPEKSTKAFISPPSWRAPLGPIAPSSRFYRMGDLGAYRSDGSFELLGRKDTQVKLRGQRIELGEIEHQARLSSAHVKEVAVELSIVGDRGPNLIGFLVLQGDQQKTSSSDDRVRTAIKTVKARLQSTLPHYMVPSMLFCIPALPLTASGKTDRRQLREMGSALAVQQESQPKAEVEKVQPSTQIEHQLQQIWTKVLSIKPATIGINDSFFELGGDSITAMKAVGEARKLDMNLMVADIFRQDTIAGLAHQLQSSSAAPVSQHFEEVALVEPSLESALLEEIDSSDVVVRSGDVAHVYPMTRVQETIAETGIVFRQLADYYYLDVSPKLDISMLESRCLRCLERFPILRSCFLRLQGKFWHVILHKLSEPFRVLDVSGDMDEILRDFSTQDMHSLSPSQPLVAFFLLRHNAQGMRLVIRMSHCQYDAFSAPLIFQSLFDGEQATEILAAPGYSTQQSYAIRRRSQSIEFWSRFLQGSHPTLIVPQLNPRLNDPTSANEKIFIEAEARLPSRFAKITAATLVRTAWCALVSRMTGVTDMVCCQVVGGRNSRLRGVEKTIGCCLNANPDRVNLSASGTIAELVQAVQDNMIAVAEADSLDFNDIVEHCTDWSLASAFDTILHHRDVEVNPIIHTGDGVSRMKMVDALPFFPFIFLVSFSKGDNIGIHLMTSSHVIPAEAANALAGNLARVIERLVGSMDMPVLSFMDGLRSVV